MVPIGTRRVGVVLVDNYGQVRTLVAKLDEALLPRRAAYRALSRREFPRRLNAGTAGRGFGAHRIVSG